MADKPILFNADMVKAILAGRKTQTRRVVNPQPEGEPRPISEWSRGISAACGEYEPSGKDISEHCKKLSGSIFPFRSEGCRGLSSPRCPYGKPGDTLWVRETFYAVPSGPKGFVYKADGTQPDNFHYWRPSIHMPREAARLFLKVKDVRVERLHDITENDAWKEGCVSLADKNGAVVIAAKGKFHALWESINGKKYPWESNPWVWVITFERRTL